MSGFRPGQRPCELHIPQAYIIILYAVFRPVYFNNQLLRTCHIKVQQHCRGVRPQHIIFASSVVNEPAVQIYPVAYRSLICPGLLVDAQISREPCEAHSFDTVDQYHRVFYASCTSANTFRKKLRRPILHQKLNRCVYKTEIFSEISQTAQRLLIKVNISFPIPVNIQQIFPAFTFIR